MTPMEMMERIVARKPFTVSEQEADGMEEFERRMLARAGEKNGMIAWIYPAERLTRVLPAEWSA